MDGDVIVCCQSQENGSARYQRLKDKLEEGEENNE